jgi:hypothetical protein
VDGSARGYEVVVYRVSAEGEVGGEPVVSAKLPAGAAAWTPPLEQCFAGGERYAWTVRAAGVRSATWSEPALFEVEAGPGPEEVEAALAVLQRYLAERGRGEGEGEGEGSSGGDRLAALLGGGEPAAPAAADAGSGGRDSARSIARRGRRAGDDGGAGRDGEVARTTQSASVPTLGDPSLRLSGNVAMSLASNVFKDGSVFLWDDTAGNTALGRSALASATGTATNNTAVGRDALRYTVPGGSSLQGSSNTAVGDFALRANTTGYRNTASGRFALFSNTTGQRNTASGVYALQFNTLGSFNTASGSAALYSNTTGFRNTASGSNALSSNTTGYRNTASGGNALFSNTTGLRNTAVGYGAGVNATTGHDNIFLGSGAAGVAGEGNTIRIGGASQQDRTFVAGIRDITTGESDGISVLIDSNGQLGTISSSAAVKQDIAEIGEGSRRLLALRAVSFRYRQHAASDPETPVQYGLIAEEVAETFPELVVYDEEGRPETVKYHLLAPLLLHELQRAERDAEEQRLALERAARELTELRERVVSLERRAHEPPPRSL